MTRSLRDKLVKALQEIEFDEDGEPSKGLEVMYGGMPYPDVTGVDVNPDNIVLLVEVFEE